MADQLSNRRFWVETALIFAGWTVFGLLLANQIYLQAQLRERPIPWPDALRPGLLESGLWAFATVLVFWLARRFPLERGRVLQRGAVHLAAAVGIAVARVAFTVELGKHIEWVGERTFSRQFWGSSSQNLLFYALLLGIAHAVLYHARYRERERAAERLAAGLSEARLQVLKAQLQPHFLFNTLNAISALIPAEARPARRMIASLGDLLRIALEHEETQEVTLREELAFLQPYLDIEQARLEERLTVVVNIAPATLDAKVPHLILQPLVENAIRHGIASRIVPGRVEISTTSDNRFLHLHVRDDGPGFAPTSQDKTRKGVGLANIRNRLEQLYTEHRFTAENHADGGVLVSVSVPLRRGTESSSNQETAAR